MNWFESVPDIWKCSGNNNRHRIIDVGASHFLFNVNGYDAFVFSLSHIMLFTGRLSLQDSKNPVVLKRDYNPSLPSDSGLIPLANFPVLEIKD